MAIIYETKEDFQRDKLDEQAKSLRLKAERQAAGGMGWIALSFIPAIFSKRPAWLDWAASVVGLVGVIDVVRSWFTGHKAHDLELQRERMGPGTMVLPAGIPMHEAPHAHAHGDCGCKHKAALTGPKSHADYAARGDEASPLPPR